MNPINLRIIAAAFLGPLALLVVLPAIAGDTPTDSRLWHRAINSEVDPETDDGLRFSLGTVSQGPVDLIGGFVFENGTIEGRKWTVVVLEGSQADDGTFSPTVELQVGDEENGKWLTVASPVIKGIAAKTNVYPGMMVFGLKVNLNALQPFIGKHKFGKVVLKTGKGAVFELSDLAPPPE